MNLKKPKVLKCIPQKLLDCIDDNIFSNYIFQENVENDIRIVDVTFDSCIFNHIDFSNIELDNVDLVDVILMVVTYLIKHLK